MAQSIRWTDLDLDKDFPGDEGRLGGSSWEWGLPESSPFLGFNPEPPKDWDSPDAPNPRLRYAQWLKGRGCPGVYLWLLPRPGTHAEDGQFRFVHVGMSTTDVHARIREHCRKQFHRGKERTLLCTNDRIHPLPTSGGGDEFGILAKALWNGSRDKPGSADEWKQAESSTAERARIAEMFLGSARVILMRPRIECVAPPESIAMIKTFEQVVGCAASLLLKVSGEDEQTTNTLVPGMKDACEPAHAGIVARNLNRMTEMLPVVRREV